MATVASVSRSELTHRRRTLRRQRRVKLFQAAWRTLAVSSLLGGLLWTTTRPCWVIRVPSQIAIKGNHFLSKQAIQSLLPLSYPQSLLRIEPEAIAHSLEARAPITEATVTRQILPPGITVHINERLPVAIAQLPGRMTSNTATTASIGLLDEKGIWMPLQSYTSVSKAQELPSLKIIGLPEQYRDYWAQLYRAVSHSPIRIMEIDCQNPANLILKTEVGIVHLGAYSSRLAEQLKVLQQMRQLSAKLKKSQIAYIDLKSPTSPLVQMEQAKNPVKLDRH